MKKNGISIADRQAAGSATIPESPPPEKRPAPERAPKRLEPLDRVDEASMDSFPCSDPPGYYPISS